MKGELRLLENIFLVILVILNVYLLNFNVVTNNYTIGKKPESTANYMDIEEIIENGGIPEVSILDHYEEKAEKIEPVVLMD